jgi:uncharacterized membrane protein YfcA
VTGWEAAGVVLAGVFAGTINTVVGSGTLVTFPALLAAGFPPVVANVSNSLGLVPGSLSGAVGYRSELIGQRRRLWQLGSASLLGGICGATLLLTLPPEAFKAIVPVLIAVALVLVIVQPWLARRLAHLQLPPQAHASFGLWIGVFLTGVYGGYFGAAQGVLLLGLMGVLVQDSLQRINAVKNVLALLVNLVAGIVFVFIAHVAWLAVLLVAIGSLAGGWLGARVGRRLPPMALRALIVVVGVTAIVELVTS